MKKFIAIVLAAVLAVGLVACGAEPAPSDAAILPASDVPASASANEASVDAHTVEAIKAKGKLVVVTEAQYAPFEFKDDSGNIVGLDAKLWEAIAKELGVELEVMDIAFDGVVLAVQSGMADIAIAGLSATPERAEAVDFTNMYYGGGQGMVVLKTNVDKYNTAEDLAGKTIAFQKGALQEKIFNEQFAGSTPLALKAVPLCVQNVKTGTAEAVLMDATSCEMYVSKNPELAMAKVPVSLGDVEEGSVACVMKGNQSLVDFANTVIAKAIESGEMQQWYDDASALAEKMGV